MKKFLLLISLLFLLYSCGSSKNYLERNDEDKALQDAVKKLNKSSGDENATGALPILYSNIKNAHLARIRSYGSSRELSRWDKIVAEYEGLQSAYDAIINSTPAFRLVTPQNFGTELLEARQSAAEENYAVAQNYFKKDGRENAKNAYTYFKKADRFIPGYKDSREQMDAAYENATVIVIINPVQDNSFFFNSGWGNTGYNYSNEYFQQTLTRELQTSNTNNRYAARFYTDWEARRDNIQPDWVVDLRLRDMDVPYPSNYTYNRSVSKQVRSGTDTSGKPVYATVYANVYITRASFNARASLEVNITDLQTRKSISYRTFSDTYRWQEESGNYTGDTRALGNDDWAIINNNRYNTPRREDILNELYRKIYPQVKNNITYTVDW